MTCGSEARLSSFEGAVTGLKAGGVLNGLIVGAVGLVCCLRREGEVPGGDEVPYENVKAAEGSALLNRQEAQLGRLGGVGERG